MTNSKFTLLILILLGLSSVYGQEVNWEDFNQERLQLNKSGMQVLGGWALANLAYSGVGVFNSSGETKAFHQMNIGWGVVNLTLASFGYFNALHGDVELNQLNSIQEHESIMRVFLFNAGLDVGYIMAGAYLRERSKNVESNATRLAGFGKSIMLQGGFLLLFDGIMFWAHLNHERAAFPDLLANLAISPSGFRYTFNF